MKCFTGVILIAGLVWCQNEDKREAGSYHPDQNRYPDVNDFRLPEEQPKRSFFPLPPPPHDHHHMGPPPHDFFHHHHHSHHRLDTDQPYEQTDIATLNYSIPLDFAYSFNDYIASDLMLNAIEDKPDDLASSVGFGISTRFSETNSENTERGAAQLARPAKCIPEMTTVRIAESEERNVFYVPECTRIERCGGCCSHVLLSCQPEETELVTFSVIKTAYNGVNKQLKYVGKVPVTVEKHTKCKCKCKVKAEDCSAYQEYRESECRCVCKNLDEEKKCYKNSGIKLWNPDLCSCQCREIQPCSTGFEFDLNECRCIQSQLRRRYILNAKEQPES